MPPDTKSLLFDMQQAAMGIAVFVDGKTVDDLKSDLMLRLAIERQKLPVLRHELDQLLTQR